MATRGSAKTTTDHDEIRRWVESRGGFPSHVKRTAEGDDPGVLRIDYPGFSGTESLEKVSWDEFFEWFDRNRLAFLYHDVDDSRFSKLVDRATARRGSSSRRTPSKKAGGGRKTAAKKGAKKAASKKGASKRSAKKAAPRKAAKKSASRKSASRKSASRKSAKKSASKKTAGRKGGARTAARRKK